MEIRFIMDFPDPFIIEVSSIKGIATDLLI
jgi:hypothetical protein